mgnify:FL=1
MSTCRPDMTPQVITRLARRERIETLLILGGFLIMLTSVPYHLVVKDVWGLVAVVVATTAIWTGGIMARRDTLQMNTWFFQ